jgi:hypothetical protein
LRENDRAGQEKRTKKVGQREMILLERSAAGALKREM